MLGLVDVLSAALVALLDVVSPPYPHPPHLGEVQEIFRYSGGPFE